MSTSAFLVKNVYKIVLPFYICFCLFLGSEASQNTYCFNNVEKWLSFIGLSQYDNLLIINGFDDVNFLVSTSFLSLKKI